MYGKFKSRRTRAPTMKQTVNTFAQQFAELTGGILESHRNLHMVIYDYGSSPSLALWRGQRRQPDETRHFLYAHVRDQYADELRRKQVRYLLYRKAANHIRRERKYKCFCIARRKTDILIQSQRLKLHDYEIQGIYRFSHRRL